MHLQVLEHESGKLRSAISNLKRQIEEKRTAKELIDRQINYFTVLKAEKQADIDNNEMTVAYYSDWKTTGKMESV